MVREYSIPKHLECRDHYIDEDENSYHKFPQYLIDRLETIKDTTFCNVNIQRVGSKIRDSNICNTITRNGDVWNIMKHKRANIKELLALQGFPSSFKQAVSNSQMKKQIGKSMTVYVIQEILKECLNCLKPP